MKYIYIISLLLAINLLAACSKLGLDEVIEDKRTTYKKSKSLPNLEIPPDLTSDTINNSMEIPGEEQATTFSEYQQQKARLTRADVNEGEVLSIKDSDNEQWLAIGGDANEIWPKLSDFFIAEGYEIDLNDPKLQVLETSWLEQSGLKTRNKFRALAEKNQKESSLLLVISIATETVINEEWQKDKPDIESKENIIKKLTAYFSKTPVIAKSPTESSGPSQVEPLNKPEPVDKLETIDQAEPLSGTETLDEQATDNVTSSTSPDAAEQNVITDPSPAPESIAAAAKEQSKIIAVEQNKSFLLMPEEYTRAWRTTGLILETAGYQIRAQDQLKGFYQILFTASDSSKNQHYFVNLAGVGNNTELVITNENNEWESNQDSLEILQTINSRFNNL